MGLENISANWQALREGTFRQPGETSELPQDKACKHSITAAWMLTIGGSAFHSAHPPKHGCHPSSHLCWRPCWKGRILTLGLIRSTSRRKHPGQVTKAPWQKTRKTAVGPTMGCTNSTLLPGQTRQHKGGAFHEQNVHHHQGKKGWGWTESDSG